MKRRFSLLSALTGTTLLAALLPAGMAAAATSSATVYVSPSGASSNGDTSCTDAAYTSVQSAVFAAPTGGTVVVCAGTYTESVTVPQQMTLEGSGAAVIDATGQPFGYAVGIAADNVTVRGLTVQNAQLNANTGAPGDGIVTAGVVNVQTGAVVVGNDDVIVDNTATGNQGNGIDVNSTTGAIVAGNTADGNGVGINVTDDQGTPASDNRIADNVADDNVTGCGIVVAEHSGAGVFGNQIIGNQADGNGTTADGAGIFLGGGSPANGGTYDNVLRGNSLSGNALAGVAVHVHVAGTANWSGNKIVGNDIGTNNLGVKNKNGKVVGDYKDNTTTGIYIGAAPTIAITVKDNHIASNTIGIFAAGPVSLVAKSSNAFQGVKTHIKTIAAYKG
jgi:parallel beta-helix repeat protein